jgi:hypothetical protein
MRLASFSSVRHLLKAPCLFIVTSLFINPGLIALADSKAEREGEKHVSDLAWRTAKILDTIQATSGASEEELEAIKELVKNYSSSSFEDKALESALSEVHKIGCEEECFSEAAISMRQAVENGLTGDGAGRMVVQSVSEAKQWHERLGIPMNNRSFAARMKIQFNQNLAKK